MERFKKLLRILLYPPVAVIITLIPVSGILLLAAFLQFGSSSPLSYVSYVVSAYTLTVICIKLPRLIEYAKKFRDENKYVTVWRNDAALRIKVSLYFSLAINTAYAIFQFGLGLYHRSFWFHSFAIYYILLVIMRYFLLRDTKAVSPGEDRRRELMRFRFCGVILTVMNLALAIIVFFMAWQDRTFIHHEITTIALAAYTFTSLTLAIINLIKYGKLRSPLYTAVKIINLTAALVSMLTLESAMLTAFGGEETGEFANVMTAVSGGAVCLFVLVTAVFMIVDSTRQLKKISENQANGQ